MPITRYLSESKFTPEERHVLWLAYTTTLRKLSLVDRDDPFCEIIEKKIVDIHRRGVKYAIAISEIAIRELGLPECGSSAPNVTPKCY